MESFLTRLATTPLSGIWGAAPVHFPPDFSVRLRLQDDRRAGAQSKAQLPLPHTFATSAAIVDTSPIRPLLPFIWGVIPRSCGIIPHEASNNAVFRDLECRFCAFSAVFLRLTVT